MARSSKKSHDFRNKLILNQWLISLFGVDPFEEHEFAGQTRRPFHRLKEAVLPPSANRRGGRDEDGLHHFYHNLVGSGLLEQPSATLTRDGLLRYEERIGSITAQVMEEERGFDWKYFQWLCLIFVEIYLERYFYNHEQLLEALNDFVEEFNSHWTAFEDIEPYAEEDLRKVCFQMATGSGKTLLMHAHLLQFEHYAEEAGEGGEFSRAILVTPNERLSSQHIEEMRPSGLQATDFAEEGAIFTQARGLGRVDVIDVHKLRDEEGDKTIDTRTLGDRNLLLVDEGHRGLSDVKGVSKGDEVGAWVRRRRQLAERGFTLEYSATFAQAIGANNDSPVANDYAKSVLFDYGYRWFYEDGYGKDYKIDNLPDPEQARIERSRSNENVSAQTTEELEQTKAAAEALKPKFLTAALLKYYQQLRIYGENFEGAVGQRADFNLEKPLWVFVGSRVTSGYGKTDRMSDVAKVLRFVADFLADSASGSEYVEYIDELLDAGGAATGLIDKDGRDVFGDAFQFLEQRRRRGETPRDIYRDILERLFQNRAGGTLWLERLTGDSGEVVLRVGQADEPFGLINVGEAKDLCDHVKKETTDMDVPLKVTKSEFNEPRFDQVKDSKSPYNLLLGSRKFIEGWNCWRVSTLGLMNIGKSEGSQIIQLFGRGVRLKGYDWSLKRSGHAEVDGEIPDHITELETLNVFGIDASYMEKFQQVLEDEGLPGNEERKRITLPLNVTHDFGKKLKMLRPKKKKDGGGYYNFKTDGPVPSVGELPDYFDDHTVEVDFYPRIEAITSVSRTEAGDKNTEELTEKHLALLDYDDLYFELERFKAERSWYNLNITKDGIRKVLEEPSWYELKIPESAANPSSFQQVERLQRVALELLKRYAVRLYNYRKRAFTEPRLELRELTREDDNIPGEDHYTITVDGSEEQLIQDIETFADRLESDDPPAESFNDVIQYTNSSQHLFQPVLHVARGSDLTVRPVVLNESEFDFVNELKDWCEDHDEKLSAQDLEIYLLRNLSRGKGVGFFEAGNFHPDFILWLVDDDHQHVCFIDPHGLQHTGPGDPRIELADKIKDVEERLDAPNITLESFLLSPTPHQDLNWDWTLDEFGENHILFMESSSRDYIENLMERAGITRLVDESFDG